MAISTPAVPYSSFTRMGHSSVRVASGFWPEGCVRRSNSLISTAAAAFRLKPEATKIVRDDSTLLRRDRSDLRLGQRALGEQCRDRHSGHHDHPTPDDVVPKECEGRVLPAGKDDELT